MIVTFGSINADLIFDVETLPTAGQTLMARSLRTEPGGKGANQALAAALQGAEVCMAGAVGQDALADLALQGLPGRVDLSRVERLDQPTGCASIYRDPDGRNEIVVAGGANLAAASSLVEDALLDEANIVLLQLENDPKQVEALLRRCKGRDVISVLNIAPAYQIRTEVLSLCDLIVVNEDEADAVAGWLGCSPSAKSISDTSGVGVLRTLGAQGVELYWQEEAISVPAVPCSVEDTTAAGDCIVGAFVAALDNGLHLGDALGRAATAASIACGRKGSQASLPSFREVDDCVGVSVPHHKR